MDQVATEDSYSVPTVGAGDPPGSVGDMAFFIDRTHVHGSYDYLCFRVPESDLESTLFHWWLVVSYMDFQRQTPKMHEYGGRHDSGSADLAVMGDALAVLLGWSSSRAVAMELALWFYCLGKIGRLISDYQQRRHGKDDTWHDLTVYSMMARRIQEVGRWP